MSLDVLLSGLDYRLDISLTLQMELCLANNDTLQQCHTLCEHKALNLNILKCSFWKAREVVNAQKLYLLKIHLNLFEISDQVLKFENLI